MPARVVREPIMVLELTSDDKRTFHEWIETLTVLIRKLGVDMKRSPVTVKDGVYRTVFRIRAGGANGDRVKKLLYDLMSKNSPGVLLNGKYYKWPEAVKLRWKLEEEKEKQVTVKKLEREPVKPKGELPLSVQAGAIGEKITLVARSVDPSRLAKFMVSAIDDFDKMKCGVIKAVMYACGGEHVLHYKRGAYKFDTVFNLKPGAIAKLTVYIPTGKENGAGFTTVSEPFKLEFIDKLNDFKHLLAIAQTNPKIIDYARRGISIEGLKKAEPEIAKLLESNPQAAIEYEEYRKAYKAFSKETMLKIEVVPETPGKIKNAYVKVWVDGKLIEDTHIPGMSRTEHPVPFSETVYWLKVVDENGNPVPHEVRVETNEYYVQEKTNAPMYVGVMWIHADKRCVRYASELHQKNPYKINVLSGFKYPDLTGCKEVSLPSQR